MSGDISSMIMDEFIPEDLDLLDDLLGLDPTADWIKLEPSLLNFSDDNIHSQAPEPMSVMDEVHMPPTMSLQPLTPESSVPSPPAGQQQQPTQFQFGPVTTASTLFPLHTISATQAQQLGLSNNDSSGYVKKGPVHIQAKPPTTTIATVTGIQTSQPIQFTTTTAGPTQFTTNFSIPFAPIYSQLGSTAVLLPPLSLVVDNNQTNNNSGTRNSNSGTKNKLDKLPLKRVDKREPGTTIENSCGAPSSKKKDGNRRSSHNAIERRYRSSINDKIVELKNLVCSNSDANEKVHKAAVLRSSIDTIRYLQSSNARLQKENRMLKKTRRCPNCGGDTLRDLLTTPPMTSASEDEFSNSPESPASSQNGSTSSKASPLALFAIAAGLFLINPVTFSTNEPNVDHHHSRVERSVEWNGSEESVKISAPKATSSSSLDMLGLWGPRIAALAINLVLFLIVYFLSGKVGNFSRKYSPNKVKLLKSYNSNADKSNIEKRKELEPILAEFDSMPSNWFAKFILTILALLKLPILLLRRGGPSKNAEVKEDIVNLYLEYGKITGYNLFSSIRALNYCTTKDEHVVEAVLLSKSKLLLRFVLLFKKLEGHTLGTGHGLRFLKANIGKKIIPNYSDIKLATASHQNTAAAGKTSNLQLLVCKFKEALLCHGITNLYSTGNGREYFKLALNAANKGDDLLCKFWGAIFWTETEWIHAGGRIEVLEKLYKLIDKTWKSHKDTSPLINAIYYTHLAKRSYNLNNGQCQKLLELAGSNLRDSINTTSSPDDKPSKVLQLVWCLVAEWILETRLALWEDTREKDFGFSKDLDTLRSLTHYVPTTLPSVYLYEACQRLMSHAAPGRTQQLLDASLRPVRLTPRAIICTGSNNNNAVSDSDELSDNNGPNCSNSKAQHEVNLVREKRKALALYLKCKHLPSQVITCPGEKAGMLREALKALEKIGEKKKIQECLEMIRALGQSVTLH